MPTTNCPSSNTSQSFAAQVSWSLTPSAPSITLTGSAARTSITGVVSGSSSTGTFSVSSVRGTRTGTNTYSASHQMHVSFTASNASWTRTGCDVYFNTSSSGSTWSNVASSATVALGTSKTLALTTSNTSVGSMNNRYFSASVNMGVYYTTQYSRDNSTWQSSGTFSSLTPNTTYTIYSRTYATSASGNSSGYTYRNTSVKTSCNAPSSLSITTGTITETTIPLTLSATGDTNAAITNYTLYYKVSSASSYSSLNLGTNTSHTLSSLSMNTTYNIYFTATNAGGTTTSSTVNVTTLATPPSNLSITAGTVTYSGITVNWSASGVNISNYTLYYKLSTDTTYTSVNKGTSTSHTLTGLNELTTYDFYFTATNPGGTSTSSVIHVTTAENPSAHKGIYIKLNGEWLLGQPYYKVNGTWERAAGVFYKVNGTWYQADI